MTEPSLHEVLAQGIDNGLRDVGADLVGCTPATLTGHIIRELRAAGLHPGPSRAYGVAPDELPPGVVLTAQRIISYLSPEWDPNDAWDYDIVGPLLRTICAALVDSPLVAKETS